MTSTNLPERLNTKQQILDFLRDHPECCLDQCQGVTLAAGSWWVCRSANPKVHVWVRCNSNASNAAIKHLKLKTYGATESKKCWFYCE